ncbi:M3 family oligoendopeptidase [Candidatus Methylacidithermus pantelleriae]|uniref:Oligoendopeptidase F n=1 Tax=Candidatus Methylacidithermus pantelleriae TaxID=2744239 RepID=A0A8J2BID8_9BACT|nr:M3 family oligoendopeptidase [Candidatus Methylacidithermus pantelleriae]CAF0697440.1 Oligoendopeptidase F [Candidatus Methylacidithermus pantelleriae]
MKNGLELPPYQKRRWIPQDADLTQLSTLESLVNELFRRLHRVDTVEGLEEWLEDASEFFAAVDQARTCRYIAMTCQTDDPQRQKDYLYFVETIDPWLKPKRFQLLRELLAHPSFGLLPPYYDVFRRSVENEVRIFREANVAREAQEAKYTQEYQRIVGAMTIRWNGQELTLAQASRILEEPDRSQRQKAWELICQRRLADRQRLEELFDELVKLRHAIACEAGYSSYREYVFAKYERFDYTPEDCCQLHAAIEREIVPLYRWVQERRRAKLGVDVLRPWDLMVDPEGKPPLRPFQTGKELLAKTRTVLERVDPRLMEFVDLLSSQDLMDLENRKGKAPGGYQSTLAEARMPFIFMNAVGLHRDVETLLHELGHAFHTLCARHHKLLAYRSSPLEFAEVASMSMELLGNDEMEVFYSEEEARRARRMHWENIVSFFPWMAMVDAFQHWVYTHPTHGREQRKEVWLMLMDRFGGIEAWEGYEDAKAYLWHRQLHIFEIPFYYIEYGIAQLGALQLWFQARHDRAGSISRYLQALSLGGSQPLPTLFRASGLRLDVRGELLRELTPAVRQELERLE